MNTTKHKIRAKKRTKTWSRRTLILFFERLDLYVAAGLGVKQALLSAASASSPQERQIIEDISMRLDQGYSLSRSIQDFVRVSPAIVSLLEYGELSGQLSKSLGTCRSLLERQDDLTKKCLSAMTYPLVIGMFAVLLTVGLVKGIMPQIIPLLLGLHVHLPLLTRVVIWISNSLIVYGLYIGLGIFSATVGVVYFYRRATSFRFILQSFISRLPLVGSLLRQYSLSVFLLACGSLVDSGLTLSAAYGKTAQAVGFLPLRRRLVSVIPALESGQALSFLLKDHRLPAHVVPLLQAGEASGTLGLSIIRASSIIDRDIEHALKKLTALIEPLMMVGMGGVVGSIALSIMLPIYDISKVLQK